MVELTEFLQEIERRWPVGRGSLVEVAKPCIRAGCAGCHLPDDLRELSIRTFRKKQGRIPSLEEQEKDYIQWVLSEANGNQTLAAQILGIDRVSLWRKLKKYQLEM